MALSMRMISCRTLLVAALLGTSIVASAQTDADKQIRTDYEAAMGKISTASGEMKDDERKAKMLEFQQTMRAFIDKWKPRAAELSVGLLDLARGYMTIAEPDNVESNLKKFLEKTPTGADAEEARMLLADAVTSLGRHEEAAALYEKVIADKPAGDRAPFAHFLLGKSYVFQLKFDKAIEKFLFVREQYKDHKVVPDAEMQLISAYDQSGRGDDARNLTEALLAKNKDAPELQRLSRVLSLYGKEAPELKDVVKWVGVEGSNISRLRGRVVVLCFFTNFYIPCVRELQVLSDMEAELRDQGVTFWGITKTYKVKPEGEKGMTVEQEAQWLQKFRENPQFVVMRELKAPKPKTDEEKKNWESLSTPIATSFALCSSFENHKAYQVRGVPFLVVIDKAGKVRFCQEGGGGTKDDFPHRVLRRRIMDLLTD